jgi:DNA-binding NarL/FixJ family response regulator
MLDPIPQRKPLGSVYTNRRPRILIADDHILIAEAFKRLLEPEFQVVGIVSDGRELLERVDELRPDVVILDISMPLLNGLDAGERIKHQRRGTKIIYVTVASGPDVVAEAFRRGASGYVLKHGGAEEMRTATRRVIRGESFVSSLLDKDAVAMCLRSRARYQGDKKLSPRQREILQLLVDGKSLKESAHIAGIKPGTVAFHKYKIMEALGITTHAGLIAYALKHNLVTNRFN